MRSSLITKLFYSDNPLENDGHFWELQKFRIFYNDTVLDNAIIAYKNDSDQRKCGGITKYLGCNRKTWQMKNKNVYKLNV